MGQGSEANPASRIFVLLQKFEEQQVSRNIALLYSA